MYIYIYIYILFQGLDDSTGGSKSTTNWIASPGREYLSPPSHPRAPNAFGQGTGASLLL